MNNEYIKLVNNTFGDLNALSSEKLDAFQREILREVFTLRNLIENPEKQEEALERGVALKALLDKQKQELIEKLGLSPEELKMVAELITGYTRQNKSVSKKNKKLINLVG